jgi:alanine-synthesizing transaminase
VFSSRIHWDLNLNKLAIAIAGKRELGVKILGLTESNPTNAGFNYPRQALLSSLTGDASLQYEPEPQGLLGAREAVSDYYGQTVPVDRILLTASTSEAYSYLFKLLADPGDEVLVPRPSYPLFEFLAALECVRVVQYPLEYHDGWALDADALENAITPRTRAIVLVNPNNPTGSYLKSNELAQLIAICRRHQLPLISDEVFADYAMTGDPNRVTTLSGVDEVLTFSLSGLSKVCGLPQMKLGWMVINGPKAEMEQALARLDLIADTFLSVSTPIQHAAAGLLGTRSIVQEQIRRRTACNLKFLSEALNGAPALRLLNVEGGWYAIVQVPRVLTEEQWVLGILQDHDTLVQPGFFYDFNSEAFLILSLLTTETDFQEGVRRVLNFAAAHA